MDTAAGSWDGGGGGDVGLRCPLCRCRCTCVAACNAHLRSDACAVNAVLPEDARMTDVRHWQADAHLTAVCGRVFGSPAAAAAAVPVVADALRRAAFTRAAAAAAGAAADDDAAACAAAARAFVQEVDGAAAAAAAAADVWLAAWAPERTHLLAAWAEDATARVAEAGGGGGGVETGAEGWPWLARLRKRRASRDEHGGGAVRVWCARRVGGGGATRMLCYRVTARCVAGVSGGGGGVAVLRVACAPEGAQGEEGRVRWLRGAATTRRWASTCLPHTQPLRSPQETGVLDVTIEVAEAAAAEPPPLRFSCWLLRGAERGAELALREDGGVAVGGGLCVSLERLPEQQRRRQRRVWLRGRAAAAATVQAVGCARVDDAREVTSAEGLLRQVLAGCGEGGGPATASVLLPRPPFTGQPPPSLAATPAGAGHRPLPDAAALVAEQEAESSLRAATAARLTEAGISTPAHLEAAVLATLARWEEGGRERGRARGKVQLAEREECS